MKTEKTKTILQVISSQTICRALHAHHAEDFFFAEVKSGSSWHPAGGQRLAIMDALAIKKSYARPCWTGYEIKVSRSDFQRDSKWTAYLPFCNRFYFVCPKGMITKDEIPAPAGLIWYDPENKKLHTVKATAYRQVEVSKDILLYLLYSRLESDRHPFFSDQRLYWESWLEDKKHRHELAHKVKSALWKQLRELEIEAHKKQLEHERVQLNLNALYEVLRDFMLPTYPPHLRNDLQAMTAHNRRQHELMLISRAKSILEDLGNRYLASGEAKEPT